MKKIKFNNWYNINKLVDPEDVIKKIDEYFKSCEPKAIKIPEITQSKEDGTYIETTKTIIEESTPSVAGLALALGISVTTLKNYEKKTIDNAYSRLDYETDEMYQKNVEKQMRIKEIIIMAKNFIEYEWTDAASKNKINSNVFKIVGMNSWGLVDKTSVDHTTAGKSLNVNVLNYSENKSDK